MEHNNARIPVELWRDLACNYIYTGLTGQQQHVALSNRTFCAYFKLDPVGCTDLWEYIQIYGNPDNPYNQREVQVGMTRVRETHLLWVLHYLCTYANEQVCANFCQVSEKTWRKYVWALLECMNNAGTQLVSSFLFFPRFSFSHTYLPYCTMLYRSRCLIGFRTEMALSVLFLLTP